MRLLHIEIDKEAVHANFTLNKRIYMDIEEDEIDKILAQIKKRKAIK